MPVVTDYTALLSGSYWNGIEVTGTPVIVTYSFPTALPADDASIGGFTQATDSSFAAFSTAEQAQAQAALGEWASASGLIFLQVAPGQGDINFSNIDFNTTSGPSYAGDGGIGFYPFGYWNNYSYPNFIGDQDSSGDIFMNTRYQSPTDGTVNYGTLLHEIGHAIGLKHPTEVVTDSAAENDLGQQAPVVHDQVLSADDPSLTIMATVGDTSSNATPHLHLLDQQAAAFIYGAAGTGGVYTSSASGSNSVSNWSWDATTQTLTQFALSTGETIRGSSVNDIIHGLAGDRLFALSGTDVLYGGGGNDSLYGGTGADTLIGGAGGNSFYVNSTATTVTESNVGSADTTYASVDFTLPANVDTLYVYNIGTPTGPALTGTGNNDGDTLWGDGVYATELIGGTGNDSITGGAGNDTIVGGGGHDTMWGNGGNNIFVFHSAADATPGQDLTTIGDFTPGHDRIDLSAITTPGGQPLHFVGTAAFSDTPGEVNEVASFGNTIVEGDVNGDGTPDFEILLYGAKTLSTSDFNFSAACFRAGTRILTDRGEIRVEDLAAGDRVVTAAGAIRPIEWIGYRHVDCRRHPRPRDVWPIRVRAGAFAPGLPIRDLLLSPDHAVYVDDQLVPIRYLANGASIAQEEVASVTYFHIELATHDVLLAEAMPAETYLDTGNRTSFANGAFLRAHPVFARQAWEASGCAPLTITGPQVAEARRRLHAHAAATRRTA